MKGNDVVVGIHKSKQQENGIQNQILLIKVCLCKSLLFIWFSLSDYFYVLCYFSIICYTCSIFIQTFVLLCVLRFHQEHKSLCGADMPTTRMEFACSASCSRDNMWWSMITRRTFGLMLLFFGNVLINSSLALPSGATAFL